MAIEDDILAAVVALQADFDAFQVTVGTPVDTDLVRDIANVQAAVDNINLDATGLAIIQSFDRQKALKPNGQQYGVSVVAAASLTVPAGSVAALIVVNTQPVRFTNDGTTPTAAVGVLLKVGSQMFVNSPEVLAALKFIETAATATIDVSYFK
jgi:hypothetical protein